jgi:hypothetical protein
MKNRKPKYKTQQKLIPYTNIFTKEPNSDIDLKPTP